MPHTSTLALGCQTITWGDDQKQFLSRVFDATKAAGYEGVEIGFRHIRDTPPATLEQMLAGRGLELIATHIGGNLENTGQAAAERSILDEILTYLSAMGVTRLMYSGLKYEDDEQFRSDLEMLRRSAEACEARGVALLYHNHDWEFHRDGKVLEALINETSVHFCPDVGWVMKGGADTVALLDRLGDRVGAIHLKDFATSTPGELDTVMLGEGVAPLKEAAEWAAANRPGLWLIAEQDKADEPTERVIERNAAFARSILRDS